MSTLSGKVAVVTGATKMKGLGKAAADSTKTDQSDTNLFHDLQLIVKVGGRQMGTERCCLHLRGRLIRPNYP